MRILNYTLSIKNNPKTILFIIIALLFIGVFLRFYNINWGAPFYFHPDERNIAVSISQMNFNDKLHPNFFAYGSLPLYFTYFIGFLINIFTTCKFSLPCSVTFEQAILIARFTSAFFSLLIIPLTYIVGEKIKKGIGLPASILSVFSTGYIQFAHFGTVEMWLTFLTLLLIIPLLKIIHKVTISQSIITGCILGLLISTKISSFPLLILPVIALFLSNSISYPRKIFQIIGHLFIILLIVLFIFTITNPYVFIDFESFQNSMRYESGVALGTLPVFYTGEFYKTIPIIYQITSIYPFLINPFLSLLFIASLILLIPQIFKKKQLFILFSFFLITFTSQSFVFSKWTRYMLPTLPFIYLILCFWIDQFSSQRKRFFGLLILISILFSVSFLITAYIESDTRIVAADYAKKNIAPTALIISEVYDLGITPFNNSHSSITLYNTYELDNNNPDYTLEKLNSELLQSEYYILPSQRVLKTRLINGDTYPVGNRFYSDLKSDKLGYRKIYQTPCSLFCQIVYLGDPVFQFESTASVFDRPTVIIFKKI